MYKFLSRSVTKPHSGTLNFTNICRKVSKTHNKSCSILKRSVSDSSIKSEIAYDEIPEEANSEQKTEELTDSRSSSVLTEKYHILKKSLFTERPRDLTQIRKFRTSSATYFFTSGIYQSKKSSKSGYPNFRVAETYKKAMEQCLKIKNQKKRNDHPLSNDNLHPKPVKFEILASEISKNTGKIESKAKIPKKIQPVSTKQIMQEMTRYKKTINIDHPKQKEPFRIVYPTRRIREKTGISLKSDQKVAKKRTNSEDKLTTNSCYKITQLLSREKEEDHYANRVHNDKYVVNEQNQSGHDITSAKMILNRYAVKSQVLVEDDNKLANILMGQRESEKIQKQDDTKNNNRNSMVEEKKDVQNHPILFPEETKINLDQNNIKHSDNLTEKKTNKYIVEDARLRSVEDNDYDSASTTKKLEEPIDIFEEQQISKNIEELLKRNNHRMSKSESSATSDINNYIKELNSFKEQSAMDKYETKKRFEQVNEMIKDESEQIVKASGKVNKAVEEKSYEDNKVNEVKEVPRYLAAVYPSEAKRVNLLENYGKNDYTPAKIVNGNKEKLQKILMQYKCGEPEQALEVVYKKLEKGQSQSQKSKRTVEPNVRKTNSESKYKSLPALPATPVSKYIRKIKENSNREKKEKNLLAMEESPISTSALLERVRQASKLKSPRTAPNIEVAEKNTVSELDSAAVSEKVRKIEAPVLYKKVKLAEEIKIRASNYANKSEPKVDEIKNELIPCKEENIEIEKVSDKIVALDSKENNEVVPLKLYLKDYPPPPATTCTPQKLIAEPQADSKKLLEDVENEIFEKRELENEEKSGFEETSKQEKEVSVEETKQKLPRARGRVFPQARSKRYSQLNVKDLKRQINDINTDMKGQNKENAEGMEDKNLLEPENNQFATKETFIQPIPKKTPQEEGAKESGSKTYKDLHLKKETTRKNRFVFKDSKLILTQKKSAAQSDLQQKNKNKKRNPRLRNRRESNNENSEVRTKSEQKISIEGNSDTNKQTLKPVTTTKMCSKVMDLTESIPTTTNDVCTSFKTFNDSYFLNFKQANRAQKQDVVERFQSGKNMTDDIGQEDTNNMPARIDMVDHFHLVKEVANKARERLKFYDKKVPVKEDEAVAKGEDVSVEQPFIRKEIPRPNNKRDDKAKKDPPKPKTGIILPPPKNRQGTKLDDEVVKSKQPPEDKLIYKNENDLKKIILMEGDEKYRDNLKYIVALIENIKIDYKDGSDPNLIKLAKEFDENKKKGLPITSKDPLKSSDTNKASDCNYSDVYEKIQENNCKDILKKLNESMKLATMSQKSTARRQPLPTHIVRKLMKMKLQRDRRKQYDRTEEYEKFFNVVTNPKEAIIQKPVLKLNHSDSSLMKMYLMEDDSNAELFIFKNKNRPPKSDLKPERATGKPSGDVKNDVKVCKEKEPKSLVNEQVSRSLKRREKFFKNINDAAVKPKLAEEKDVIANPKVEEKPLKPISDLKPERATDKPSGDVKNDVEEVCKETEPKSLVNEHVLISLKRREEFFKDINDAAVKPKLAEEKDVIANPNVEEKPLKPISDLKPERAADKPSGDVKNDVEEVCKETEPKSLVNQHVLRSLKRREKFFKDINDAAVKPKLAEEKDVIANPNVEEKPLKPINFLSKATPNTIEKDKSDTTNCLPIKKSLDPKNKVNFKKICGTNKPDSNIKKKIENVSPNQAETGKKRVVFVLTKSSPAINNMSEKCQSNEYKTNKNPLKTTSKSMPSIDDGQKDSKTKALIKEFEKKSTDPPGKYKNKILQLEQCFNRIVKNLKKLDERGQLVKSVVSSVNGMVYKCTNKFLEDIFELKEAGKQKQSDTELNKQKEVDKINKCQPKQSKTDDKNEASQVLVDTQPQYKQKEVQQPTNQMQKFKTDKARLDIDVMKVIKKSLYADDLLKKADQKNISTVYTSKLQSMNASDKKVVKDLVKVVIETEASANQIIKVMNDKVEDDTDKSFKDVSDNQKILENDEKSSNVLAGIRDKDDKEGEDNSSTMKHIEMTNSDLTKNLVRTITVENSSGEIKTLKGDHRVDRNKNCNSILKHHNIVKIIVQTQNANIVITSNKSSDSKSVKSNEPSDLGVAVDKVEKVGKSVVEKKSLESQFEEANTMKKLISKVSEAVNIIGDLNISNKMYNYIPKMEPNEKRDLDVQKNDSEFLYKNVFTNLDALKMPHIFNNDRIKASDQIFKTSASKISTKSLEQLNKEECTRYCFAEYDYSYAKRRAKKQLDKKLCKLDTDDGLCFKAYFSSVERRMNKAQDRSPSIKFHKKKGSKRKLIGNKNNFNCSYSTMARVNVSRNNLFQDQGSVTGFEFEGNEERILSILSDKDGDKPDKPSDKKMPKEDDKTKKSDKSSKKTVFKIIRAPNIYRAGRRYTKSIKLKSKNAKKQQTETPKKSTKSTYHGRRNVILYLLQNQLNNKINKANFKSETKLNPKEEIEKTVNKFKVDVTHDNDADFHTVSLTDTELYKEKRLRDNRYKNRVINSKTKTSVNDFNKKSTNIKVNPDENVNKGIDDKIIKRPASKYLLESQAVSYKKYSADLKGNGSLKERILKKQSILKSTISQKSTSKFTKSENKSKNDKGSENNKTDDEKPPKASLNDELTKPESFQEILNNELSNIFENGPPDYTKLVAKVEEIVDNKDSKLYKFNKNLNNFNQNKFHNLRVTEITIEKDLGNIHNFPPQVARETFGNSKKDCEIVRIPTKSLFQTIYSLPSENDTTLTKRNTEKIMSVRKSGFRRYPGIKITYVAANKGDTDFAPGHFSPRKSKINLLKEVEADTQSIVSARYELLKKLQDEFNKLHSIGTNLELNQTDPNLNKSENQSEDCKDAVSQGADDTCSENGSNQSLVGDKIVSDLSSNSDSEPKAKNNLESILKTWINRISSVYENDKKDPNK